MPAFTGFPSGKVRLTRIPAPFFTDLLPAIDHLGELKITLYALWFLDRMEGNLRYITFRDCLDDKNLTGSFGRKEEDVRAGLADALERAVLRGTLLKVTAKGAEPEESAFFLNSPRGRAAVAALQKGEWTLEGIARAGAALDVERPSIFSLYEQNIGPLTPMMVDTLRDAEQEYPAEWIEEAVRAAVENNARRWRYVDAILRSRKERGRHDSNRRNTEEDRRGYVQGEYADFIEH
jgi:DnaD/phage-associated family protein